MGGTIVHTRDSKKHHEFIMKKEHVKRKRAKVCISCENNEDGFCSKHGAWCSIVNLKCIKSTEKPCKIKKDKNTRGISNLSSKDLKKTKALRKKLEDNPDKTIEKLKKLHKIK